MSSARRRRRWPGQAIASEPAWREASRSPIHLEVDTWADLEELKQLVLAAQEDGHYCKDTEGKRLKLPALIRRLLVAHTFAFLACIKECHQAVKERQEYSGSLAMLRVPEAFHAYPEIAATIDHAIISFCESLGHDYEGCAHCLFTMELKVLDSLAGVRMIDLVRLSPAVRNLTPAQFATIIRARFGNSGLSDNAFYMAVLCYLDQSTACQGMAEQEKLVVYKQLAEALFFPCDMTGDYVSLVVSTCPYLLKSGMLARAVAAAAAPRLRRSTFFLATGEVYLRVLLADLLPFKTNQKQYYTLEVVLGRVLVVCVQRRASAKEGEEDRFALSLLAIYPGTAASHGGGPFAIKAMAVQRPSYCPVNIAADTIYALVHFEEDPEPALHELDPEEAETFSLNRVALLTPTRSWSDVVRPDSPLFHGENKAMCIGIKMKPFF